MSELTFALLRYIFLILLWIFVLIAIMLVRKDIFQAKIRIKKTKNKSKLNTLYILTGPLKGSKIPLGDNEVKIGRDNSNTLLLNDDFVSSFHAKIFKQNEEWFIEDEGSTNGTIVDKNKIENVIPLTKKSKIKIGKTTIVLGK